jgi:hypothetical protein
MKPIILLTLILSALASGPSFAADSAPSAYRESAVFNVTSTVVNPDPGGFTATFVGPSQETLISAEYEPFIFRHRLYSAGNGENTIPLSETSSSGYDVRREGFFDGATVRIYRIINGELRNVRVDKIARHRSSGWGNAVSANKLIAPDRPEFQWHFADYNSPVNPYYFAVVAVSADGTRSAPSAALKVMRTEKVVRAEPNNSNLIDFKKGATATAPATPGNFKVITDDDGLLRFTWDAVPGAVGYRVLRSDYPPDHHFGYGFDLVGKAKTPIWSSSIWSAPLIRGMN